MCSSEVDVYLNEDGDYSELCDIRWEKKKKKLRSDRAEVDWKYVILMNLISGRAMRVSVILQGWQPRAITDAKLDWAEDDGVLLRA